MSLKFLILPVLIPLSAGIITGLGRFNTERIRNRVLFASTLLTSLLILCLLLKRPSGTLILLHLSEELPFILKMDEASFFFLALIAFLWPLAILYTLEYMEKEANRPRFFCFYLISYGITAGVALSANLLTTYFFYELLTLVTIPLVAHEGDRRSMAATRQYIVYSLGGAALSFTGMVMLFSRTGCQEYNLGGSASAFTGDRYLLAAYLLTFIGFGVKAAVFPLHKWLPAASVAPTPVTALLHAVAVVKSGVFAAIRSTWYAFGPGLLAGTWAKDATLAITSFTILFGSVMAFREQHMKRRLAYSTISNLSYILFGMSLLTTNGLTAAFSHMLFHGIIKITLFFCAGTVLIKTGREYVHQTAGLGRKMPLTFSVFFLSSLALSGIPLLPGYISKMCLIEAATKLESRWAIVGIVSLLLSALLTAAYLIPLSLRAFFVTDQETPTFTPLDKDPGVLMLIPLGILSLSMLYLGIHAEPLMNLLNNMITGGL
jgi:multicomponent Na+:H+ antiporter subunit D